MFDESIDNGRVNKRQVLIFVLCLSVLIIDGLDFQLLAFASPVLLVQWHITKTQLAPALAAALFGMSLGAAVGGFAGDRFGCRRTLVWVVTAFGATTLASALVTGTTQLMVFRFLSGFGFGVAVPAAMALVSEWCPRRLRGQMIIIMSVGTMVGGTVGGLLAAWLIPAFGWQSIFFVSGGATLLCAALNAVFLPESLSFLMRADRQFEALRWFARVIDPENTVALTPADRKIDKADSEKEERLFSVGNLRLNLGLWLGFFTIAFASYAYLSWSPTLLVRAGLGLQGAIKCTYLFTFAAVIGCFISAAVIGRIGSHLLVVVSIMISVCASVALPGIVSSGFALTSPVNVVMAIAGLGTGLSQSTIYAIAATAYPASYRSTGLGLCVGLSRCGGIVSVLSGGALLGMGQARTALFFGTLAAVLVIGLIGLSMIGRHIRTGAPRRAIV